MAELSPTGVEIAILVAGALLYAFIWFATRNLSRAAKILARAAPLGLIVPAMIYLSALPGSRQDMTSQAPSAGSQPPREYRRPSATAAAAPPRPSERGARPRKPGSARRPKPSGVRPRRRGRTPSRPRVPGSRPKRRGRAQPPRHAPGSGATAGSGGATGRTLGQPPRPVRQAEPPPQVPGALAGAAARRAGPAGGRLGRGAGLLRHGPRAQGRAQAHRLHRASGRAGSSSGARW